jgi:hypothetical protein
MTPSEIKAQAAQLFAQMCDNACTLPSMEARCDQVEIDAVQAMHRREITEARKLDIINISFEVRRLIAERFVGERVFPRR